MNISVVVPAYNAELWIEESLESVRRQEGDVELIVVDDCSQDQSGDLARKFLDSSGLAGKVLTTDGNNGPANARNLGWRSATGEWIQFLDSDDLLAPKKLRVQYADAKAADEDVAVLYSPWQRLGLHGATWSPFGPVVRSDVDIDTISRMLQDVLFGYVGPTLIRRRALEAIDGFSSQMSLGEDLDLMLRIAMSGFRFQLSASPEPLFYYRDTPQSQWQRSAADPEAVMHQMRSLRDTENFLTRSTTALSASTKRALATRYTARLDVLGCNDRRDFDEVLSWISDLRLRSAPYESGLPARLLTMVIGLRAALKMKFILTQMLSPAVRRGK